MVGSHTYRFIIEKKFSLAFIKFSLRMDVWTNECHNLKPLFQLPHLFSLLNLFMVKFGTVNWLLLNNETPVI